MPSPLPDDVRIALAGGQKVEAVRLLREHTGLGLAEAMAAVESGLIPSAAPRDGFADPLPADVGAALAAGCRWASSHSSCSCSGQSYGWRQARRRACNALVPASARTLDRTRIRAPHRSRIVYVFDVQ
jgi:hypothetical protein